LEVEKGSNPCTEDLSRASERKKDRRRRQDMSDQENRDTVERYFQALARHDLDTLDALLHDDYVEEYPQSGERIRGKQNFRTVAENYPGGLPNVIGYSIKHGGDLGTRELLFEYDGNRMCSCFIVELEEGKIKSAKAYFGGPFEAPEWRAQWVERM
jgi:SnoaL-like domain